MMTCSLHKSRWVKHPSNGSLCGVIVAYNCPDCSTVEPKNVADGRHVGCGHKVSPLYCGRNLEHLIAPSRGNRPGRFRHLGTR